ncbi:MAG: purine-nucleoside phosphorylase [Xanthomonadales bacterium]|nr:purine-nucleoside phosphorylase [Gammaproteobacteria bacterium]NNK05136.1 purine-nucleoside phosphorylase [Xanthomonadales bacterium]NNK97781.1 purine-nucleoside phosphorylase [Xanthomonadales bacterium]
MTGTPHIEASRGDFAETVLMPGDPLRAQALATRHLEDVRQVNSVRNMLGFTGTYKGERVSIMGSGMGMPSISIYAHELFDYYAVKQIIRVGTCGGLLADMQVGDLVLASAASTDSAMNRQRFGDWDFAANADFGLLQRVHEQAVKRGLNIRTGNVFASDWFYHPDELFIEKVQRMGVLALDMESAALYALAQQHGRRALTILSVSDVIPTGERASHETRQNAFGEVIEVVFDAVLEPEPGS